eukprot:TRINITY_DN1108_c0_g2_i1.p1 TRINITY_DN1108_c0_g2~~TRINITY_DN1108_c0_g2_i1.p1  ORF type:complete len:584 (+),score=208.16 TRINITY_DN1108_c0_g2_i1:60-1811(+)
MGSCCGKQEKKGEDQRDGAAAAAGATSRGEGGTCPPSLNATQTRSRQGSTATRGGEMKALPGPSGTYTPPAFGDTHLFSPATAASGAFDEPTNAERSFRYREEEYVYVRPKGVPAQQESQSTLTLLLLGETGSGKSTLVNAMVNHARGVSYDDPTRYRVVKEGANKHEHTSQTREVGVYKVWCDAIQRTLRIIDTPGFGDTGGIEQDEENANLIKSAIEREREIHGVCFVAAASRPRLTHTQQYVISRVLGSFGRDAANGIFILATFADGKRAPVLDAFRADSSFPFSDDRCFHFNNSALYATGSDRTAFTRGFWELGRESMMKFFRAISNVTPFELQNTIDVIATQRRLEGYVKGLTPQVTVGISKATNLTNLLDDIRHRQAEINETGSYRYTAAMPRVEKETKKPGTYTTQCMKCSYSCHEECTRPDHDKHLCCVMDAAGNCVVCPSHCHFSEHRNLDYIFVWYTDNVTREYDQQKLEHLAAKTGLSKSEAIRQEVTKELVALCGSIKELLKGINAAHVRLSSMALRPTGMSLEDYLSVMVTEEMSAKKSGFEDRVAVLNAVRGVSRPPPHLQKLVSMISE